MFSRNKFVAISERWKDEFREQVLVTHILYFILKDFIFMLTEDTSY